jgi:hypothetical protein
MGTNDYETIRPATEDYRNLPERPWDAFRWDGVTDTRPDGLHLVTFTAILKSDAEPAKIDELKGYDYRAHEEAAASDGYLWYFPDEFSAELTALSFCVWSSLKHGREASRKPHHKAAVEFARGEGRNVYLQYMVRRYLLERDEPDAELRFSEYQTDDSLVAVSG